MMRALTLACVAAGMLSCAAERTPIDAVSDSAASETAAVAPEGTVEPALEPGEGVPGRLADGRMLLPNGWILDPEGVPLTLGDFPAAAAISRDGRWLAVVNCGAGKNDIRFIDVAAWRIVQTLAVDRAWIGVQFSSTGDHLYASGGTAGSVLAFGLRAGVWVAEPSIALTKAGTDAGVGGIALDAGAVIAAMPFEHRVLRKALDGSGATLARPLGAKGQEIFPWDVVADPVRGLVFVSLEGTGSVAVLRAADLLELGRIPVGPHPNEMVLDAPRARLFVACANDATVRVVDVGDPAAPKVVETLNAALHPEIPSGHTTSSVALAPDGTRLYVADSDAACVAVFDVATPGMSRGLGFIPTGWYPTQVRLTPDGARLVVICAKGFSSRANPNGPRPDRAGPANNKEWIGSLLPGGALRLEVPNEASLAALTVRAYRGSPLQRRRIPAAAPLTRHPLRASPSPDVTHAIYIIKENRTFDQILGDMPGCNADPALCLFGDAITPNHHALAREFVLLDNFYVDAEVSADGHEWTMGAYATDFVEKVWPPNYGSRGLRFPSEGAYKTARPLNGYLWDRAAEAHVTYRSYGEFITNNRDASKPGTATFPVLEGHFDPMYRSFDLNYSDQKRADRFLAELAEYEKTGDLPRLITLRLPNDHTAGTRVGSHTPRAMVADNDLALGRIIAGLTRSRYWQHLAVFVVEDDAQNGADHVDAHRSPCLVISPWTRGRGHDGSQYTTAGVVRTLGLVLGMEPLSIHDGGARPMLSVFTDHPDYAPYTLLTPSADLDDKNVAGAYGAVRSAEFDLDREDAAPDLEFNDIIWRAVRGASNPMPPPVRSATIRTRTVAGVDDDDDDDG